MMKIGNAQTQRDPLAQGKDAPPAPQRPVEKEGQNEKGVGKGQEEATGRLDSAQVSFLYEKPEPLFMPGGLPSKGQGDKIGGFKVSLNYSPSTDLVRISTTESITGVNRISGDIQARMKRLRNSGGDPETIKKTVAAMKRVLGKARAKVQNLKKEEKMEQQRRGAEAANNEARERQIAEEIRSKRNIRKSREYLDIADNGPITEQGDAPPILPIFPPQAVGGIPGTVEQAPVVVAVAAVMGASLSAEAVAPVSLDVSV